MHHHYVKTVERDKYPWRGYQLVCYEGNTHPDYYRG